MDNKDHIENIEGAERRMINLPMEFREEGEEKFFEGMGIVFNTITDMGWYTEEVAPEAIDSVMKSDVRGLFNHDTNIVLGRTKSGTMTITKEDKGAKYRIKFNPNDPDHVKVYEKVKRGDVSGSSFSFEVMDDQWSTRGGRDHRKITKLKEWYDVGPVTFPAYEKTTVAARSLSKTKQSGDAYKNDLALMDLDQMKNELK